MYRLILPNAGDAFMISDHVLANLRKALLKAGKIALANWKKPMREAMKSERQVVTEAGGKVTTFNGKDWNVEHKKLIASNGIIHDELMKLVK